MGISFEDMKFKVEGRGKSTSMIDLNCTRIGNVDEIYGYDYTLEDLITGAGSASAISYLKKLVLTGQNIGVISTSPTDNGKVLAALAKCLNSEKRVVLCEGTQQLTRYIDQFDVQIVSDVYKMFDGDVFAIEQLGLNSRVIPQTLYSYRAEEHTTLLRELSSYNSVMKEAWDLLVCNVMILGLDDRGNSYISKIIEIDKDGSYQTIIYYEDGHYVCNTVESTVSYDTSRENEVGVMEQERREVKRFLLFAGNDYYPNGGVEDFVGSFSSMKDIQLYLGSLKSSQDGIEWANALDIVTGTKYKVSIFTFEFIEYTD